MEAIFLYLCAFLMFPKNEVPKNELKISQKQLVLKHFWGFSQKANAGGSNDA